LNIVYKQQSANQTTQNKNDTTTKPTKQALIALFVIVVCCFGFSLLPFSMTSWLTDYPGVHLAVLFQF